MWPIDTFYTCHNSHTSQSGKLESMGSIESAEGRDSVEWPHGLWTFIGKLANGPWGHSTLSTLSTLSILSILSILANLPDRENWKVWKVWEVWKVWKVSSGPIGCGPSTGSWPTALPVEKRPKNGHLKKWPVKKKKAKNGHFLRLGLAPKTANNPVCSHRRGTP